MASVERSNPQAYAKATEAYPVLSDRQLERRAKREIAVSQMSKDARIYFEDLLYAGGEDLDSGAGE